MLYEFAPELRVLSARGDGAFRPALSRSCCPTASAPNPCGELPGIFFLPFVHFVNAGIAQNFPFFSSLRAEMHNFLPNRRRFSSHPKR